MRQVLLRILLVLTCSVASAAEAPDSPADIEKFTGARTRVVWLANPGDDLMCQGDGLTLWGLDTSDGKGPRQILAKAGYLNRPFLSPDGKRVFYTDPRSRNVHVVNFDGSDPRTLCRGFGLTLWRDPATRAEWLYVQGHEKPEPRKNPILRYPISDLARAQVVWDKTDLTATPNANFQLSADGTRAAALFPWPRAGLANLRDLDWQPQATGCWPSIAPDNSYRFWVFDNSHRSVTMFGPLGQWRSTVTLSGAPNTNNKEVYHPRWSNHVRFITHTSPKQKGNVYIARLAADFRSVEGWTQVTRVTAGAAMMPDVWVDGKDPDAQVTPTFLSLPSPWRVQAFGTVAGGAFASEQGNITIQSNGGDIWGAADGFHYVHQALDGDGQITARIAAQDSIGANSRIAVMIRQVSAPDGTPVANKPSPGAPTVHMSVRPGKKTINFSWRQKAGGECQEVEKPAADLAARPGWVRLCRQGDEFTGYHSRDGREWKEWGRAKVVLDRVVSIGMGICGDAVGPDGSPRVSTATFADIAIVGSLPDQAKGGPIRPTSTQPGTDDAVMLVRGKVISVGRTPTLREIEPYTAALTADLVEVQESLGGPAVRGRMLVCRYAIRDGKTLDASAVQRGDVVTLQLAPMRKQSIEGKLRLILPDEGFELPAYLQVQRP